ncbi:bifunctional phosphopantothenoylcysteine decarboxylase/phosphopantothenate--cysteine ligase CoaBC [Cryomorpha ignava]|uniref:Coenzyme A biosynthesis bifunctional protein CoaBC n=1 Tax=Cryomorpha ignava TaxID=101383 RepID=A0A7K3WUZ2_9FLAO|nr:bifunctional phosphopantothenoylcysteine decarboxylase/phosphopantothenate--cysteine ligase CoaBC [Cryomorpha ignava]NEN25499.1 bifunctional phosphopantothenoylcysteine decarboxylase/phosphopantothenate--cysteine ligase CoaBC [Cryomorpha ignava]
MGLLEGKHVLLGITGSIAAYKSAFIVRDLIKEGADVQVILTPSASDFVTPLTLGTLSKRPVLTQLVKDSELGVWNNHVDLGLWADVFLIAPASANTLAKMAGGEADNLLLTSYLSAKCPVFFAPAMDLDMHAHGANQANIERLVNRGNIHIPSESGELASGLFGAGRMAEPLHIIEFLEAYFTERAPLKNKKVLITAGPTQEPIDPVRYIGNRSTGKMGYEIARAAAALGADVTLISGPVALEPPKNVKTVLVNTAAEMYKETLSRFDKMDIGILSAAVSDYRPVKVADEKIKKSSDNLNIELEKTDDILKSLGAKKKKDQILIGFALETENALENAKKKREEKNCDMIVLNSLRDKGAGFGHDTNKVILILRNKNINLELKPKSEVAKDIFDCIIQEFL